MTRYGAGNRGIDYSPGTGAVVGAAGTGIVSFAGQVGGSLYVVIDHGDGIRTTYAYLSSISVKVGDRVQMGSPVGTAGSDLHFGARRGDRYIDPTALFGGPYLVADNGGSSGD